MTIKQKIQSLITAANAKTGESDTTLTDAVQTLVDGYGQGGGTTITNGIVFTSVDANSKPVTADIYGLTVPSFCFGSYNGGGALGSSLRFVTFKSNPTTIGSQSFAKSALEELIVPDSVTTFGSAVIRAGTNLKRFVHENAGSKYGYGNACWDAWRYSAATKLEEMVLGAIGKPVTAMHQQVFTSFGAPSTAIVKIYCLGTFVDTCLTQLRTPFASQKIIFYAAEATTYNGTSYAAGETMLTSEVT